MTAATAPRARRADKSQRRAECQHPGCSYKSRWLYDFAGAVAAADRHNDATGHFTAVV